MAMKIRTRANFHIPGAKQNEELRKNFKSFLIWENKQVLEAAATFRKQKTNEPSKTHENRSAEDKLGHKANDWRVQEILEIDKIKPLSNPSDPYDDINVFWSPRELLDATIALSTYNVKELYKKNPYTVKNILHLVLLVIKYKPLLKDLLEVGEYFERFPEDSKDEIIVCIALFDILCRGNGITLENEMDASLRADYKNIGLKVIYMQVEKDRIHYFEQVHDRLDDIGASSVHDLLPISVPIQINIEFPMIFDIWINRTKLEVLPEQLLQEAGFKRAGTRASSGLSYNEIAHLPYSFELGVSNYFEFAKTSHYQNHVFIPTDRNHCLAMAQMVRQLYKGGIQKGTIIQTHILSLSATAYFACLLNLSFPAMKLNVFGADRMKESFESYFELLNLKNVKVFSERFYIVNCRKKGIASTTCALVNPETVFHPSLNLINETINRGCDIIYLQSAYELFSENDTLDNAFINQYNRDLKEFAKCNVQRALSIPKVKFIMYQSFDIKETAIDNIALHVVKYARECSHTSIVSYKEGMSPTDLEDANYKYCRKLDLYFMQGNTPDSIVSPALWGSKPPFITTIYRIDPVINHSETEGEGKYKYRSYEKILSSRSNSVKSAPHGKLLKKFTSVVKSMTSESKRGRYKNSVRKSGFSSDSYMTETLMQIQESPPDFKKMVLSEMMHKNEPIPSEKRDPVLKKILKNKRHSKKNINENKEVLFSDQVESGGQKMKSDKSLKIQSRESVSKSCPRSDETNMTENKESSRQKSEDASLSDEVKTGELTISSQNIDKLPSSSYPLKKKKLNVRNPQNKIIKKESVQTENVLVKDEAISIHSQKDLELKQSSHHKVQASTRKKSKTKRKNSGKELMIVEDYSIRDEVNSINSQEISALMKMSRVKSRYPSSSVKKSGEVKTRYDQNKKTSKNESIPLQDDPSQINKKSFKQLKKDPRGNKSEKRDKRRNMYPTTSKQIDSVKVDETLFMLQHSPIETEEIVGYKVKKKNLPKKSFKNIESKISPTNFSRIKKESPIISFGTIIHPKSSPIEKSKKNLPSRKVNTMIKKKDGLQHKPVENSHDLKKKTYKKENPSFISSLISTKESVKSYNDSKSFKFKAKSSKKLNEMEKRFKQEILQNFQTEFFHSKKQSDAEEKSTAGQNRPSSSVSWRTYNKTARKLSELNLIKLLKKESLKNEKKRRKKTYSKRSKSSITPSSTESVLREIYDDKKSDILKISETILWNEYGTPDFKKIAEIDGSEIKTSFVRSLSDIDKNEKNSITSSLLAMNQKELTPSIIPSHFDQSSNTDDKIIHKKKKKSKSKIKRNKKTKNAKSYKKQRNDKSEISLNDSDEEDQHSSSKIILENSEATQTKTPRKAQVVNVGTQADHLQIYMTFTSEEERKESLRYYTDLIHDARLKLNSFGQNNVKNELEEDEDIYGNIPSDDNIETDKKEINRNHDDVMVTKVNSWFQQLKSEAPIPPRVVSYVLRRRPIRKSTFVHRMRDSKSVQEDDDEDMIEEGVDDNPPLNQNYQIEDAQTILAQMKLFEAGERDLNKLINTDISTLVNFDLVKKKYLDDHEHKVVKPAEELREEIVALTKNILKFKAHELSQESITEGDGYEEEEPFDMETTGKEMNNLLTKLVENIFETDTKPKRGTIDEGTTANNVEENIDVRKTQVMEPDTMNDMERQFQSPSMEEVLRNIREEENRKKSEMLDNEDEELEKVKKSSAKQKDLECNVMSSTIYNAPRKTPTDGLSPLAKELYEIRDLVEYYLHSNVEPLDWRVMIDRPEDD